MAEFCLKCWNELHKTDDKPYKYVYAKDYCEGCGQWTKVISRERNYLWFSIISFFDWK